MRLQKIQKIFDTVKPHSTFSGDTVLVARQPIFDVAGNARAYELLFRDPGMRSFEASGKDMHMATSTVMIEGVELMRPTLRPGQRLFINFTGELLEAELASILPPDLCVIEIIETVQPTQSLLQGVRNLKKNGYMLALDDYTGQEMLHPFLELVDIVKVDVLGRREEEIQNIVDTLKPYAVELLAEKVEDPEMAAACRKMGFGLFQGFFYSKAEIVRGKKLSPSQITKTRLLAFSTGKVTDIIEVAQAISADVYLTYKLLKYVNSVYFGLPVQVRTVQHAIMLLGRIKLLQWLCVTTLSELDSAPMAREIVYISAFRAKFLELLALHRYPDPVRGRAIPPSLFLLGLFSLLESLLHMPLEEIALTVPVDEEIVQALAFNRGPYAPWLQLLDSYERGDWEQVHHFSGLLGLSQAALTEAYTEATHWSTGLFGTS